MCIFGRSLRVPQNASGSCLVIWTIGFGWQSTARATTRPDRGACQNAQSLCCPQRSPNRQPVRPTEPILGARLAACVGELNVRARNFTRYWVTVAVSPSEGTSIKVLACYVDWQSESAKLDVILFAIRPVCPTGSPPLRSSHPRAPECRFRSHRGQTLHPQINEPVTGAMIPVGSFREERPRGE